MEMRADLLIVGAGMVGSALALALKDSGLKILLLDFSVLAGIQFFGRAPLPKALAAVFCGFGVAFAALAAGKLAV